MLQKLTDVFIEKEDITQVGSTRHQQNINACFTILDNYKLLWQPKKTQIFIERHLEKQHISWEDSESRKWSTYHA